MQRALSGVELERDSADVTLRPQRRCDGCLLRLCDAVHFVVVVAGVGNADIMVRLMMTIIMVNRSDIWRCFHFFVVYCFIFHLFRFQFSFIMIYDLWKFDYFLLAHMMILVIFIYCCTILMLFCRGGDF